MILFHLANLDVFNHTNPQHQRIKFLLTSVGYKILWNTGYTISPMAKKEYETYPDSLKAELQEAIKLCEENRIPDLVLREIKAVANTNDNINNFLFQNRDKKEDEFAISLVPDFNRFFQLYLNYGILPTELIGKVLFYYTIKDKNLEIDSTNSWEEFKNAAFELWEKADSITETANESKLLYEIFYLSFICLTYYVAIKQLLAYSMSIYKKHINEEVPQEIWKEHQVVEEYRVWTWEILGHGGYVYIQRMIMHSNSFHIGANSKETYKNCLIRGLKDMRASFNIYPKKLFNEFLATFDKYVNSEDPNGISMNTYSAIITNILRNVFFDLFEDTNTVIVAFQKNGLVNFQMHDIEVLFNESPFNYSVKDSQKILQDSLRISQIIKSDHEEANCYNNLGLFYANLSRNYESLLMFNLAKEKFLAFNYSNKKLEERIEKLEKRLKILNEMMNEHSSEQSAKRQ